MIKLTSLLLTASVLIAATDYGYNGSTTAAVALIGGVIKASHIDKEKKYPRKDCPVCKGKGWYISGDGIKKVDCGYCEPETSDEIQPPAKMSAKKSPFCKCENCECENCECKPKSVIIVR